MQYHEKFISVYQELRQKLLDNGCEKFVIMSEEMYQEYKDKDGIVTCEHSTKDVLLGD